MVVGLDDVTLVGIVLDGDVGVEVAGVTVIGELDDGEAFNFRVVAAEDGFDNRGGDAGFAAVTAVGFDVDTVVVEA